MDCEDNTETIGTPGLEIDFPVRIAVSLYNAASGPIAYDGEFTLAARI